MRSTMGKRYDQYCPIAHALDLVGDRWALLVVRELMHGPQRYTDLVDHLPGIGTNILAARLRDLEAGGVIEKRKLPPPAASRVYVLTEYGECLKPALRELALWGAQSLGPPNDEELVPGWLRNALDIVASPVAPKGRLEFRVGDEVASLVDGVAQAGPVEDPDVVVEGDANAMFHLLTEGQIDFVSTEGDRRLVEELLEAARRSEEQPAAV
jgi:DNA-binding HxlR family transcriptional regulator